MISGDIEKGYELAERHGEMDTFLEHSGSEGKEYINKAALYFEDRRDYQKSAILNLKAKNYQTSINLFKKVI